ncbi:MAG: hypothetical protein J0L84_14100, partial [Verrucomicrobia bacterium]|nr:hypothetical protein [Verrucomicrobiota bacterium]
GDGSYTDLATGDPGVNGIPWADPVTGLGYRIETDLQSPGETLLQAWDLPSGGIRWTQRITRRPGPVFNLVPMGRIGVLFTSDPPTILPAPPDSIPSVDLGVAAEVREPIWGTNQWLTLEFQITHRGDWAAAMAALDIALPPGISSEKPGGSRLRIPLGSVVKDTRASARVRVVASGLQPIRISVVSATEDPNPVNNSAEIPIRVPEPPQLLLSDHRIVENDAMYYRQGVRVSLTSPAPSEMEIQLAVEPVSAQSSDLVRDLVGVQLKPGESHVWFNPIREDATVEPDETFRVTFVSGPVEPVRSSALITIVNDDLPRLRARGGDAVEGNAGRSEFQVPVSLSAACPFPVEVSYRLAAGTASAVADYLPRSGRLLFPAGSLTQFVTVPIVGDRLFEAREDLTVEFEDLSAGFYEVASVPIGIPNDDPPPAPEARLELDGPAVGHLRFDTLPGVRYTLQIRTNLSAGAWEFFPELRVGDGAPASFLVPLDPARELWFRVGAE